MLAAHFPTATSRCDLREPEKVRQRRKKPFLLEDRHGSSSSSSLDEETKRAPAPKKSKQTTPEAGAYAAVSFLYALGQALYDIFSSQQAQTCSQLFGRGFLAAYAYAMLVSAYPFAKAISSPYVGYISDTFGRRRVLVATLAATALCLRFCGNASTYRSVLLARLLTGCVANGGLLTARATDVAADHAQRTRLFSLFTTAWATARVAAAVVVRTLRVDLASACRLASWCELAAAVIACFTFSSSSTTTTSDDHNDDKAQDNTQKKETSSSLATKKEAPVSSSDKAPERTRPSFRALAKEMLSERLALCLFLTSMLTPRVDATAFVSTKFSDVSLAEAVGYLKAVEAVAVVLMSLTPISKFLSSKFGDAGAAIFTALLVAVAWLAIAAAPTMPLLYAMVFARSAFAAVYDPAARSLVWARAASREKERASKKKITHRVGSLVGLQQSLKGATQVFSSWLGAYLTNVAVSSPLLISAAAMLANASAIAYLDWSPILKEAPPKEKKSDTDLFSLNEEKKPLEKIIPEEGLLRRRRRQRTQEEPTLVEPLLPYEEERKDSKIVSLVCRCETTTAVLEQGWSVAEVAEWLENRGQHQAAKLASANGVDGTCLAIAANAQELRDAFNGAVSLLVCRAILSAFRSELQKKTSVSSSPKEEKNLYFTTKDDETPQENNNDYEDSSSDDDDPSSPLTFADRSLTAKGRLGALALRESLSQHAYDLVVVSPDRASLQTALLALTQKKSHSRRFFVAHDAAALPASSSKKHRLLEQLQLEYGAAVDFTFVDELQTDHVRRKIFALVAFLEARPERRIALVADAIVLDALLEHYSHLCVTCKNKNTKMQPGDARDLELDLQHHCFHDRPCQQSHNSSADDILDDDEPETF